MPFPGRYKQLDDTLYALLRPLLSATFARDQWSQRYLYSLAPVLDETLIQSIFHLSPREITSCAEAFHFHHPGHAAIQFKATLVSLIGQPQRLALIVLILDAGQRLLGFWRKTFWRTADHELECHFDMIKTRLDCDALRGISKPIKPYFDQLHQNLGVAREFVEADWIGRLVWADYYQIDEAHFYIEDGQRLSTLELWHRNFDRFLRWHHLQYADLILVTPTGPQPLSHPEQLAAPADFACIEHRHGLHVNVEVLLDDPPRRLEHRSLPVGKAFILADFTDIHSNTVELIDGYYGESLCDRTMPYWFGVKHLAQPRHTNPRRVQRFERHEIVIVGAGLAGLVAAARLEGANLQPVIYEANPERIGGRIRSLVLERRAGRLFLDNQRFSAACLASTTTAAMHDQTLGVIEAGGEFIGCHHTSLQNLAQELGLGLVKVEPSLRQSHILVSPSPGTVQTLNAFASQHGPLLDRIRSVWDRWQRHGLSHRLRALPLNRFFDRIGAAQAFCNVIHGFVRAQFGAEMHQVALCDWFEMQPFDPQGHLTLFASDEFSYRMQGGLQQLPLALERQLTQPVRTGHRLTELRSADDNRYMLDFRDLDGKRLRVLADFVILAVPVNTLKHDILFDLPMETSRAISWVSNQTMGHNTKLIAWFRNPFWRHLAPDSFFYLSAPDFTLWEPAMATDDTSLHPLVIYAGGSMEPSEAAQQTLINHVFAHLEHACPTIRQDFVTLVLPMDWSRCPYTQGSYTGFGSEAIGFERLHGPRGPLRHSHLTLAGEALSLDFRGFAEGAVETGLRASERIMKSVLPLPRPSCPPDR